MKRLSLIFLSFVLAVVGGIAAPQAAAQASDWQRIKIPPLPSFHPQEPKRIELPNGMVIFLQEDHELPLIDGLARIRGGSRPEPANKIGLPENYAQMCRTGGPTPPTRDQLDDLLEVHAPRDENRHASDV